MVLDGPEIDLTQRQLENHWRVLSRGAIIRFQS